MRSKVIIDGVEYAPVSKSNPNAKQIAIALIGRYMGKFDENETLQRRCGVSAQSL